MTIPVIVDTPFVTEFPRDQRFALETPSCLSG
jgi:hypothetical protein